MGMAKMNEIAIPINVTSKSSFRWRSMVLIEHIIILFCKGGCKDSKLVFYLTELLN
jgi:hypothetical protein